MSQIAVICDWHWLQNLVLICYSTDTASNGDKPYTASDGEAVPHPDAAPVKAVA